MKAEDVINQLQAVLPQVTDLFSDTIVINSITAAGTVATATTAVAHGLSVSDAVSVAGAEAPVAIASLDRVGTLATVVTSTSHDITLDFNTEVTLSGFTESEFNGTFPLVSSDNRVTFVITVPDAGPVSGSGTPLLEIPGEPQGYNGLVAVDTVPTPTTFTYTLPRALTEAAVGSPLLHTDLRITGTVLSSRALAMYTSQATKDDLWAFVILGDVAASKDRQTRNDGISAAQSSDRRQQLLQEVSILVFAKASQSLSGRAVRDLMEDVAGFLFKSLLGVKFDNGLSEEQQLGLVFISHGLESYDGSVYEHSFNFQLLGNINTADTVDPGLNVAFRDIQVDMTIDLGTEEDPLTSEIDLDKVPLP